MKNILFATLLASFSAHAAPATVECVQKPGYHRKAVDTLSLTLLSDSADAVLGPKYRQFALSGHLARLSDAENIDYRDIDGKKVDGRAEYDLLPVKFDCLTAPANSFLFRCDAHDVEPIVLRDKSGAEFRLQNFGGDVHGSFAVHEHRDLGVNPDIVERVTRTFDFHLTAFLFTGQLVAMNRSVTFEAEECATK